jgi:phage gp36-like protein
VAYATSADLVSRYGETEILQLTDRAGLGVVDELVAAEALDDASAEVDTYLVGRYDLPLATTPLVLVRLTCEIARYRLYPEPSEAVRRAYEDARRVLEQLAAGKLTLGLPEDSAGTGEPDWSDGPGWTDAVSDWIEDA